MHAVYVRVSTVSQNEAGQRREIQRWLDESTYEKGRKVSDEELAECLIKRNKFHGEWNYEIHPRD
jgi:DNA invertase Pin-like site-specific DNA recombinase